MLQSFGHSQQDWFCSEPLLFDDDFCQSLMKDLQSLPTPPQSPPMKAGPGTGNPLSKEDQLSYVSDLLLEDHDMQLNWKNDFFPRRHGGEGGLWQCLTAGKMLGSSPLLSDIDTSIFEEIAGSTLDCQNLMDTQEPSEATSDYGSAGGELSTYSSSDSGESRNSLIFTLIKSACGCKVGVATRRLLSSLQSVCRGCVHLDLTFLQSTLRIETKKLKSHSKHKLVQIKW
uniref:Uncharacterized protein n=1 Tax=Salarias fasciatus TaxID=181472 RepID=A0A672HLS7_SALFA